jgi:hypothetical protein
MGEAEPPARRAQLDVTPTTGDSPRSAAIEKAEYRIRSHRVGAPDFGTLATAARRR